MCPEPKKSDPALKARKSDPTLKARKSDPALKTRKSDPKLSVPAAAAADDAPPRPPIPPKPKSGVVKTAIIASPRATFLDEPEDAKVDGKTAPHMPATPPKTVMLDTARVPFLKDDSVETRPPVPVKPPERPGSQKTVILGRAQADFLDDFAEEVETPNESAAEIGGTKPDPES